MSLDNVIFPGPFRLANRNPLGLSEEKQMKSIANFRVAVFESAQRASKKLHSTIIPAGSTLVRNLDAKRCASPLEARRIPENASTKTSVRWSGLIEKTDISRGALYTSLDIQAQLNEAMRYKRATITKDVPWKGSATGKASYTYFGPSMRDYKNLLIEKVYYSFKLLDNLKMVDLSASASSEFYEAIEGDRGYQKAKSDLGIQVDLWRLAFDPVDYTVSRPLGLSALLDSSVDGLKVPSAQQELTDLPGTGTNLVLGGDDGKELMILEPTARIIAGSSGGHQALIEIGIDGSRPDPVIVVPGSVLPITGA